MVNRNNKNTWRRVSEGSGGTFCALNWHANSGQFEGRSVHTQKGNFARLQKEKKEVLARSEAILIVEFSTGRESQAAVNPVIISQIYHLVYHTTMYFLFNEGSHFLSNNLSIRRNKLAEWALNKHIISYAPREQDAINGNRCGRGMRLLTLNVWWILPKIR